MKKLEVVRSNSKGVYKRKNSTFNDHAKKWVEKEKLSTFFPYNWSYSKFILECFHAFKNKHHIKEKIYRATTPSGIKVEFIIDSNNTQYEQCIRYYNVRLI